MSLGQVQSLLAKRVGIRVRRRRVSHIGGSGEHRAFGAPMNGNRTLWTLRVAWFESVFFASFLCRFGQRNDAPPRAVANSDKEIGTVSIFVCKALKARFAADQTQTL